MVIWGITPRVNGCLLESRAVGIDAMGRHTELVVGWILDLILCTVCEKFGGTPLPLPYYYRAGHINGRAKGGAMGPALSTHVPIDFLYGVNLTCQYIIFT